MGETSEIVLLVMNLWLQVAESDYLDKIKKKKLLKIEWILKYFTSIWEEQLQKISHNKI